MKKRLAVLLGAGALTMAALSGCGATTESIVDKMFDQDTESFAMTMDMDVDVSAGISGMNIDLGASGTVESEVDNSDEDSPASHMTMDLKASAMGSSQKVKTESYIITDDKEVSTYVKDPDTGDWTLTKAEVDENPLDKKSREKIIDEVKDVLKGAELQKKTEKKEGQDCYVLKLNTTLDAFDGVIDVVWDAIGDEVTEEAADAGLDKKTIVKYLSYINIDANVYASKKDGYLVAMDLNLAETDVDGFLKQAGKDFGDMTSGLGIDLDSISIDISALAFNFTFSDWNDVEVEVPKDVKNNAVESGFDLGGGDDWDDDGWDDGDDDDDDDDDDDNNNTGWDDGDDDDTSSSSTSDIEYTSSGAVVLYDWMDKDVAHVAPLKGYELQEEYSSKTSLMYTDGSWSYYYVSCTGWADWEDVMQNGEKVTDDGYDYYVLMDGTNCKMVVDLGVTYDGFPVLAAVDGEYDESASDFSYATYYITFEYGDGNWCQVMLDSSKVSDWEPDDYTDAFDQIFQ